MHKHLNTWVEGRPTGDGSKEGGGGQIRRRKKVAVYTVDAAVSRLYKHASVQ